jgi:thiamine pyrophosphokinase
MASLLDNLSIVWTGDFDSLKKFTSDELNQNGNWEHPGIDKKIFKSDTTSIYFMGKLGKKLVEY